LKRSYTIYDCFQRTIYTISIQSYPIYSTPYRSPPARLILCPALRKLPTLVPNEKWIPPVQCVVIQPPIPHCFHKLQNEHLTPGQALTSSHKLPNNLPSHYRNLFVFPVSTRVPLGPHFSLLLPPSPLRPPSILTLLQFTLFTPLSFSRMHRCRRPTRHL
jgi:hypothetical protein